MSFSLTHNFSPSHHHNVPRRCRFAHHHRRCRTISLVSRLRRHHRRRLLKHHPTPEPSSSPLPPTDRNLQIILTVDRLSNSKALNYFNTVVESSQSKVNEFVCAADEAFKDLQTLVSVDANTKRVEVSCRRSSVEFLGVLVISSLVIVFIFRGFIKFLVANSYGSDNNGGLIYKRDRSLGGKEVVVGKTEMNGNKTSNKNRSRNKDETNRLLMMLNIDNELLKPHWGKRKRSLERKLPNSWPVLSPGPSFMVDDKEEYQRMANILIRAILDNRMRGVDISADDIVQVRRICKTSGVRVFIDTENSRDSFYRAAVDFVLNCCESIDNCSAVVNIDGEDARNFVAGLSENIGVENIRAARMVSASVAARTRSRFLQAWALEIQGNHAEVLAELLKICLIHRTFPPDACSPEMEMVARGLKKQLKLDQREFLFNTFIRVCGEDTRESVAEALGVIQPPLDTGKHLEKEQA